MIQWYPGHMAKAKREMQKRLRIADVVIEIIDARAPEATRNPDLDDLFAGKPRVVLLNKEDLADPSATAAWVDHYKRRGCFAASFCAVKTGKHKALFEALDSATKKAVEALAKKGVHKPVRAMVTGIPNVGKSSVINVLSGGKRAKVGAKPGVTRGQQWVRISPRLELLDTPGVLWPKFDEERIAQHLAFIGSIRDEILEPVDLAKKLIDALNIAKPGAVEKRFKLEGIDGNAEQTLEEIAKKRGCVVRGGALDVERAANILIKEFRQGKLGRITLEWPREGVLDEAKGDGEA